VNFRLILDSYRVRAFGVGCLLRSTVASPIKGWAERNPVTNQASTLVAESSMSIPRFEGNTFLFPASSTVSGTGALRVLATGSLLFVRPSLSRRGASTAYAKQRPRDRSGRGSPATSRTDTGRAAQLRLLGSATTLVSCA
jgi:hypothetical protein